MSPRVWSARATGHAPLFRRVSFRRVSFRRVSFRRVSFCRVWPAVALGLLIMLPPDSSSAQPASQSASQAGSRAGSPSAPSAAAPRPDARKALVAHRGASAYAPEHTLAAYRLALTQGADFVEQDLALTKDGVLICLHDTTLERTTNVEEIFPDRFIEETSGAARVKRWYANDFTLAEIKRLDAGVWFDAKFAGERVPTFQEAIDLVKGKAGIFPELKDPELYRRRGTSIVPPVLEALKKNGLDQARGGRDGRPSIILQSFDEATLRELARVLPAVPRVFLIGGRPAPPGGPAAHWLSSAEEVRSIAAFATGIGPSKDLVVATPAIVAWAHAAGLTVTPYTFRSANTGTYGSVAEEMTYFLYTLGVDAIFTDNPDHFPRRR